LGPLPPLPLAIADLILLPLAQALGIGLQPGKSSALVFAMPFAKLVFLGVVQRRPLLAAALLYTHPVALVGSAGACTGAFVVPRRRFRLIPAAAQQLALGRAGNRRAGR